MQHQEYLSLSTQNPYIKSHTISKISRSLHAHTETHLATNTSFMVSELNYDDYVITRTHKAHRLIHNFFSLNLGMFFNAT